MRQSLHEYDDRSEDYELVGEERAEAEPPRRIDRRLPALLLSVGAMVVFAGGLWFAYVQGTRHATGSVSATTAQSDGVPILHADARPTKIKPDQPGGMAAPDQNISLYNEKPGGAPVEKLLPAPEQPMPRPTAPPPAANAAPPVSAPAQPGAPAATKPGAKAPAKSPAADAAAATPPRPVRNTGPVQVRLGSVRTPEAAREEWTRLKKENADLLGKLTANAVRTDLGGDKGIYYRIEAGVPDAAAAEKLCTQLKTRSLGCILVR